MVASNLLWPKDLRPSRIPLVVVSGAPASGKSHLVAQRKSDGDIVIDLDVIVAELSGTSLRSHDIRRQYLPAALTERNRRLGALASTTGRRTAWFIVGAPAARERWQWAMQLSAARVIVLETSADECVARINRDASRKPIADELCRAVFDWWTRYTRRKQDEIIDGRG